METTGENIIQVKKERSYISCLVKGCGYGFKNLGMLLRYIWPSLVLAILLPIPFIFFFAAQMDAILRKWTALGYVPNVKLKAMKRDIELCSNRSAFKVLIYMLWMGIALVGLYAPFFIGIKIWWGLVFFFLVWLLPLPLSVVIMQVSYSDNKIKDCLRSGFRIGYRNYGKLFAFEFLSNLLQVIIVLMGALPLIVLQCARAQALRSIMMGDATVLPVSFYLYAILGSFIYWTVAYITLLVFSFSRCLMWGSLVNEVPAETEANS